jgi:hypothetical protein
MRQAIFTKFLGPTNSRGSRVKASADAGSVTVSWDHALNSSENHRAAAMALAVKFGWSGTWVGGGGGVKGDVYVNVETVSNPEADGGCGFDPRSSFEVP